jgi:hypothetical protein
VSNVIDMGVGFNDIEQVLDMSEFLSNTKELINKFEPQVNAFLVKKGFFKGPFLRRYNEEFDQLIRSLIKKELMNHFQSWTPEDLLLLTEDVDFLKMIASELFDQENYRKAKLN